MLYTISCHYNDLSQNSPHDGAFPGSMSGQDFTLQTKCMSSMPSKF